MLILSYSYLKALIVLHEEMCPRFCNDGVETAAWCAQVDIPAERMIKPEDVAEAALLPFRWAACAICLYGWILPS